MRGIVRTSLVIAGFALIVSLMPSVADADGWDINSNRIIPLDFYWVNTCTDPWQKIHVTGEEHWVIKARKELDDEGLWKGWDMRVHSNHQGGKGVAIKINEDGTPVLDEEGNPLPEVEYSIPGHYQFTKNINKNGHDVATEVFMCHMISHGDDANLLLHVNRHVNIDEDGNINTENINSWIKCAGTQGPPEGPIDCGEFADYCECPTETLFCAIYPDGPGC